MFQISLNYNTKAEVPVCTCILINFGIPVYILYYSPYLGMTNPELVFVYIEIRVGV